MNTQVRKNIYTHFGTVSPNRPCVVRHPELDSGSTTEACTTILTTNRTSVVRHPELDSGSTTETDR